MHSIFRITPTPIAVQQMDNSLFNSPNYSTTLVYSPLYKEDVYLQKDLYSIVGNHETFDI